MMSERNDIMNKKDLYDISVETHNVSMIIRGISNQLEGNGDKLTHVNLQRALCGIASYLERIVEDLNSLC